MFTPHRTPFVIGAVSLAFMLSCGAGGQEAVITPNGGDLCYGDRKICLSVPARGLSESVIFRIAPGSDAPGAPLSESFDISATNGKPVTFLLPATVTIRRDLVDASSVPDDNLLRIYTRDPETNAWVSLDSPTIDRLRGEVVGKVSHLSPFVVLRADRLPDGTLPIELDASVRDAGGPIVVPPVPDAGRPDAGRPDAGMSLDGGRTDAGMPSDGGMHSGDAGAASDAGMNPADAGMPPVDAGQPPVDAGSPVDSGSPFDAGGEMPDGGDDAGI